MVIGGRNEDGVLSNIEAVSLQNEDFSCNPQHLPYGVADHSSVHVPSLKGVLTCGGWDENLDGIMRPPDATKCVLQTKDKAPTLFASMNKGREDFGMVSNGQKIFSFGGYGRDLDMETIGMKGGQWEIESMPFNVNHHCVVRVQERIIITGGMDFTNFDEVSKPENIFLKDKNFF